MIADIENLTLSARDLGYSLSYGRLAAVLAGGFADIELHAYFSREKGDESWTENLARFDWRTHPRDIERAITVRGEERFSNSDHAIAFGAGLLASDAKFDVVLLGTGDGTLGCDLAAAIRSLRGSAISIQTVSVAGSTSRRLAVETNRNVNANVEIGKDCLVPLAARYRPPAKARPLAFI